MTNQNKKVREEFEYIFVTNGKIEVVMANKKGQITGRTELLLTDIWIKIPKKLNLNETNN